jgi:protein ImuA
VSSASRLACIDRSHIRQGDEIAASSAVLPSGHAALDAQLPGGGWPLDGMVEVLQGQPGRHAWQLLLPALVRAVREQVGPVVLVGAPFAPFGPSLAAQGLPAERLLCVSSPQPAARLWATEQALRCAEVAAVLAWLPRARAADLRRLHIAAQQHNRLLFVFRGEGVRQEASPARLRLLVEGARDEGGSLQLHILKRRGPPLQAPLRLPAHPARLAALLQVRQGRAAAAEVSTVPEMQGRSHALDRIAVPG